MRPSALRLAPVRRPPKIHSVPSPPRQAELWGLASRDRAPEFVSLKRRSSAEVTVPDFPGTKLVLPSRHCSPACRKTRAAAFRALLLKTTTREPEDVYSKIETWPRDAHYALVNRNLAKSELYGPCEPIRVTDTKHVTASYQRSPKQLEKGSKESSPLTRTLFCVSQTPVASTSLRATIVRQNIVTCPRPTR